jgi:hypothetical protein
MIEYEDYVKIIEAFSIIKDLKRCGDFYHTAIELDIHDKNFISGEDFEERINKLLNIENNELTKNYK